jgi:glycosyltransferase involved in cell wall biosynthesis
MSCVYKGFVIDTDLSRNAKGGTEMMRQRLINNVSPNLLNQFAIHISRPRKLYEDVPNILWCHDLAEDKENDILFNGGWKKFEHFVFVSYWQRDQYIERFKIPYSKCSVIQNAIETEYDPKSLSLEKAHSPIRFIYHTTPHRGLALVYPIFDALSKEFDDIHLDVYSSFKIYGWENRDKPYEQLFNKIKQHPKMTYHGTQSNDTVIAALKKSHIFLFPSIWKETSCISMIEAIRCGCIVIHPSYGALTETSSGATLMYEFTENLEDHANRSYNVARNLLLSHRKNPDIFEHIRDHVRSQLPYHSISVFTNSWNDLLQKLLTNLNKKI